MIPLEIWSKFFEKISPRDRLQFIFLSKKIYLAIFQTFSDEDLVLLDHANLTKDRKLDRQVKNNFLRGRLRWGLIFKHSFMSLFTTGSLMFSRTNQFEIFMFCLEIIILLKIFINLRYFNRLRASVPFLRTGVFEWLAAPSRYYSTPELVCWWISAFRGDETVLPQISTLLQNQTRRKRPKHLDRAMITFNVSR